MILLDGHSLTPAKKVRAEAMSLQLKERDATANMTPASADGITVNSWLKDDTNPGAGIVWRVKSIQQAFNNDTVTISLEHAINTLRDKILFGEVTPAMMAGRLGATTCTAQEAINYILSQQSDWVLDTSTFAYGSVSNPYKFDGETLFEAIQTISDSLTDPWWSYDMSVYPFKLKITAKQSGVDSILRPGRNLRTISKTIDKSQMFTRFYPIGADDLHIDSSYVEKNTSAYGVVSKVETDNSITTKAELTRWANERLNKHAEPAVTIDIEGLELSSATGENMDRLTLGRICAVYLPEFGTTIQERITALSYSDKIGQPETVKITLANTQTDIMKVLADSLKKGGKSSRSSAKRDKEDMAWFEDTNDHVAMVAKGIVGVDAQGNPNWIRLSQIVVSGTGIDETVQSIQNDQVIAEGRISITENEVGMTVKRNDSRQTKVYPTVADLPATGSSSYKYFVEATGRYYKWENNAYVEFSPNGIAAAEIVVAINESTGESEAKIDAQHVYIGNTKSTTVIAGKCSLSDVSATYIKGQIATIDVVGMIAANVTGTLSAGTINGDTIQFRHSAGAGYTYTNLKEAFVASVELVNNGNNTYTINTYDANANKTEVGTFSKAVTPTLSGSWSNGKLTVTSSPAAASNFVRTLSAGTATWSGNTATVPINALYGSQQQYSESTGWNVYVNASSIYTNGYNNGSPSSLALSSKYSNMTWNFTVTKGDGTTVTKTADCTSIYSDARSGYYTQAQYDSHYKDGVTDGWQSVWFHWSDSPKNTNYGVTDAIGKYMTAHYTDADGVYHEWDTSWGPIPNPGGSTEQHPYYFDLYCTDGGQVPGGSTFRYRFSIEFTGSRKFTAGTTYRFWRQDNRT